MTALHPSGRCNRGDHDACSFAGVCPCVCHDQALLPRPTLDALEASCRVLMSEIAALAPAAARGSLDAKRARRVKTRALDEKLDLYNLAATAWSEDELCPSP